MNCDGIINTLLISAVAVSCAMGVVLCIAEFVMHRPMTFAIPSVYWPIAKIGLSGSRPLRRVFRFLFSRLYRKRFWNPLMNSLLKTKGFHRQRHLSSNNIHAACSALVLTLIVIFLHAGYRVTVTFPEEFRGKSEALRQACLCAAVCAGFELAYNAPAIIVSRYLYLLTLRRPVLSRERKTSDAK